MTYSESAALGAALLDRESPQWWRRVDLADLDMGDCARCVLGQVYGWYFTGTAALRLEESARIDYGFSVNRWSPAIANGNIALDEAWVREVAHRLSWDVERATLRALRAAEGLDPDCGCGDMAAQS